MASPLAVRLTAGLVVLAVAGGGTILGLGTTDASEEKVKQIRQRELTAQEAQTKALDRDFAYEGGEDHFLVEFEKDQAAMGLRAITLDDLRKPNPLRKPITSPVSIKAGKAWSDTGVSLTVASRKMNVSKQGITVKRTHTTLKVMNTSEVPIAYFLRAEPTAKQCSATGSLKHNAMALQAGEVAELTLCGGESGARILELRVMDLPPLGYMYVSKVPPAAVGQVPNIANAHTPPKGASVCSAVPSLRLSEKIGAGELQWEDVVDFHARHNCDRVQFADGYKYAPTGVDTLPWGRAPEPAPAAEGAPEAPAEPVAPAP